MEEINKNTEQPPTEFPPTFTKKCKICGLEKPLEDFRRQTASKDGRKIYCRPCDNEYIKKYYHDHRDKKIAEIMDWQRRNKNKMVGYKRRWYNKKKKKLREIEKQIAATKKLVKEQEAELQKMEQNIQPPTSQ